MRVFKGCISETVVSTFHPVTVFTKHCDYDGSDDGKTAQVVKQSEIWNPGCTMT